MNKINTILTITAIILAIIIVGEIYIFVGNNKDLTIAKNDSTTNLVSSDTTKNKNETFKPKVKSIKTEENTRIEPNKSKNDLSWHEITSRSEVKSRINGTTWETIEYDTDTGLWYKFVIYGDNVDEYSAMRTRNYNDPKDWHLSVRWRIYGIYEPEKGLFCVALKGKDGTGIYEDAACFISFKGNLVFYSFGNDHIFLKLVD